MARSGVAHLAPRTEAEGIAIIKQPLSFLPQNSNEDAPRIIPEDRPDRMEEALNSIIPDADNQSYDIRDVIDMVFDRDSFLEIQPHLWPPMQ